MRRLRSASCSFDFAGQTFLSVRGKWQEETGRMPVLPGIQEGKRAMAEKIVVQGAPRATRGKNEARRLRQAGQLPAVLYGGKGEAITLAVNTKQVSAILRSETG